MGSRIKKCLLCGQYVLKEVCTHCGGKAGNPLPPHFSPLDPYGKYRRIARNRDINAREQGNSPRKECRD
ncbi:MAG: RNA-protein complex protein Nop10 [Methanomethylovorans sp.]|uniref:RNA-protein complex protein Nop10 n=1 Tax=Methanomethylovorans sp. TaxID=2758717 RepID=UPI00353125FF